MPAPLRILVIRRDNIGDLICTTPLLCALRQHFPEASLSVLVSSYNVAVLDGNHDIDEVFVFLKRHQKSHGYGFLSILWHRWQLVNTLRKRKFDYILLANGGWRYAQNLGAKKIIGFRERNQPDSRQPDVIVPLKEAGIYDQEVSKLAHLGITLGIPREKALGPTRLFPDLKLMARERQRLMTAGWKDNCPTIALHISARYVEHLWPEESLAAFAKTVMEKYSIQILLLWSPGAESNRMHPGDDEKAQRLLEQFSGKPLFPCPTADIPSLIAAVALVDQMVCSDGGAMHVAAALQKPILSFFGTGSIETWHPWAVPYIALRHPSKLVSSISLEEALAGFGELQQKLTTSHSGYRFLQETM